MEAMLGTVGNRYVVIAPMELGYQRLVGIHITQLARLKKLRIGYQINGVCTMFTVM